ncbi:hypothetical protein [Butyrivibrio sp. NC2002]|jgi:hypothetical protein|uniref:hypothetical protein n=1 Tax=Butyrivibrio sp. NC2002 TaxID=1410610 RepID=UPI000569B485|nr:hypothetical protein [Butyrivibrio sp. NC2002]
MEEKEARRILETYADMILRISYGSDQEETQMITNLSFDVDGVHYCLMTFDTTLTVDDLFDMAEELITEGK